MFPVFRQATPGVGIFSPREHASFRWRDRGKRRIYVVDFSRPHNGDVNGDGADCFLLGEGVVLRWEDGSTREIIRTIGLFIAMARFPYCYVRRLAKVVCRNIGVCCDLFE